MSDAARCGVCAAQLNGDDSGSINEWTHCSRGLHWGLDTHDAAWKTVFVYSPLAIWRTQSFTADLVHFLGLTPGSQRDIHTLKCLSGPGSCQNIKPDANMPKPAAFKAAEQTVISVQEWKHIVALFLNPYFSLKTRTVNLHQHWKQICLRDGDCLKKISGSAWFSCKFISPAHRRPHCRHINSCENCSVDECGYSYLGLCSQGWEGQLVLFFASHFKWFLPSKRRI